MPQLVDPQPRSHLPRRAADPQAMTGTIISMDDRQFMIIREAAPYAGELGKRYFVCAEVADGQMGPILSRLLEMP